MADLDGDKLNALVGKTLGDLGGAFSVPTVRIGFRLGLFNALNEGPATAAELARRAAKFAGNDGPLAERYVREWALAQAANGYVTFDAAGAAFSLSPEQAMVFAVKDSPVYLAGAFDLVAAMIDSEPEVEDGFRSGKGVAPPPAGIHLRTPPQTQQTKSRHEAGFLRIGSLTQGQALTGAFSFSRSE